MYQTLFDLAGIAMAGWLLLILLPTWRVTRRVAESAIFPVFLSVLYLIGIAAVLRESGPGFMGDFGSAEGVLGLLQQESIALIAWIHILAFDHAIGILIYRDNMKHRYVPVPVQSVLLAATLMLGPIGFLGYWAVRAVRRGDPRTAWGERDDLDGGDSLDGAHEPEGSGMRDVNGQGAIAGSTPEAPRYEDVVTGSTLVERLGGLWRRHRLVTGVGLLGFIFAAATVAVATWNGGWLLAPEGRLLEAAKFDVALGIYTLTVALILPLAAMTAAGRRRWVGWTVGLTLFAYLMENVQAWRGLDPRFSEVAGPIDQMLGGLFLLQALGLLVLFVILMRGFFRADALSDRPALRVALRYATGGALMAFGVGVLMSALSGRELGAAGDLMLIHAAGFHALQAVPLIALLAGLTALDARDALRWTHIGGAGWLLLCTGLVLQAVVGQPLTASTPMLGLVILGALTWASAFGFVLRSRETGAVA